MRDYDSSNYMVLLVEGTRGCLPELQFTEEELLQHSALCPDLMRGVAGGRIVNIYCVTK